MDEAEGGEGRGGAVEELGSPWQYVKSWSGGIADFFGAIFVGQRWEFIKENKTVRKQELDLESDQENMKKERKQELDQESDQENKKKLSFFLDHFLARVLVFFLFFSCFLTFLFSFYKFSPQVEGLIKSSSTYSREASSIDSFVRPSVRWSSSPFAFAPRSTCLAFFFIIDGSRRMNQSWTLLYIGAGRIFISTDWLLDSRLTSHSIKNAKEDAQRPSLFNLT